MIFAAGFGTRMGALTAARPKPLIPVAGRTLLDRALDLAGEAGAAPIVVNLHYLGQQIADHLAGRDIALSWEREQILETGGGLRQALPLLGPGAVATLNPDVVWTGPNPLIRLQAAWGAQDTDALLMVGPVGRLHGHSGRADFAMDAAGRLRRYDGTGPGYLYLGAQMLRPEGLAAIAEPAFSLNRFWDICIAAGRAHGLVHEGQWCDVGTPAGLAEAEALLRAGAGV